MRFSDLDPALDVAHDFDALEAAALSAGLEISEIDEIIWSEMRHAK
jgi:hypothetical protein